MKKLLSLFMASCLILMASAQEWSPSVCGHNLTLNQPVTIGGGTVTLTSVSPTNAIIRVENITYSGTSALFTTSYHASAPSRVILDFYGENNYTNTGIAQNAIKPLMNLILRGNTNTFYPNAPSLNMTLSATMPQQAISSAYDLTFMSADDKTFTVAINTSANSYKGAFLVAANRTLTVEDNVDLTISVEGGSATCAPLWVNPSGAKVELADGIREVSGATLRDTVYVNANGHALSSVHFADYYNYPLTISGEQITSKHKEVQFDRGYNGYVNVMPWTPGDRTLRVHLREVNYTNAAPLVQLTEEIDSVKIYVYGENTYNSSSVVAINTEKAGFTLLATTDNYGSAAPSLSMESTSSFVFTAKKLYFGNALSEHFNITIENGTGHGIYVNGTQMTVDENLTLDVTVPQGMQPVYANSNTNMALVGGQTEQGGATWNRGQGQFVKDSEGVNHIHISDATGMPIYINGVQVTEANKDDVPFEDGKIGTVSVAYTPATYFTIPYYTITLSNVEVASDEYFISLVSFEPDFDVQILVDGENSISGHGFAIPQCHDLFIRGNGGDNDSLYLQSSGTGLYFTTTASATSACGFYAGDGHLAVEIEGNNYALNVKNLTVGQNVSLHAHANETAVKIDGSLNLLNGVVEAYGNTLGSDHNMSRAGHVAKNVYFDGEDRTEYYDVIVNGVQATNFNSEDIDASGTVSFDPMESESAKGIVSLQGCNNVYGTNLDITNGAYNLEFYGSNSLKNLTVDGTLTMRGAGTEPHLYIESVSVTDGALNLEDGDYSFGGNPTNFAKTALNGNGSSTMSTDNAYVYCYGYMEGFTALTIGDGYKLSNNRAFDATMQGIVDTTYSPAVLAELWEIVKGAATAVEHVEAGAASVVTKALIDGQLYILRDGKTFDLQGRQLVD